MSGRRKYLNHNTKPLKPAKFEGEETDEKQSINTPDVNDFDTQQENHVSSLFGEEIIGGIMGGLNINSGNQARARNELAMGVLKQQQEAKTKTMIIYAFIAVAVLAFAGFIIVKSKN
jgi:hypothetical protein